MKKLLLILLLAVYGISVTGATVHMHYCMGKFVGSSLWHEENSKCGKCGMKEKKDGCCKDEHKHFKLKSDQVKSSFVKPIAVPHDAALIFPVFQFNSIPVSFVTTYPNNHAPPLITKSERLHLLNCVFLI